MTGTSLHFFGRNERVRRLSRIRPQASRLALRQFFERGSWFADLVAIAKRKFDARMAGALADAERDASAEVGDEGLHH